MILFDYTCQRYSLNVFEQKPSAKHQIQNRNVGSQRYDLGRLGAAVSPRQRWALCAPVRPLPEALARCKVARERPARARGGPRQGWRGRGLPGRRRQGNRSTHTRHTAAGQRVRPGGRHHPPRKIATLASNVTISFWAFRTSFGTKNNQIVTLQGLYK